MPYVESEFAQSGSIGELLAFTFAAAGDNAPSRAQVFDVRDGVGADVSSSRRQIGAVAAAETIRVWVHVTRRAGTLEIVLGSANTQSSAVTDRVTESGITATGLYLLELDGAESDDWWRLEYNLSGGSPDFDIAAAVAIETT